jgi:hypothetical protein
MNIGIGAGGRYTSPPMEADGGGKLYLFLSLQCSDASQRILSMTIDVVFCRIMTGAMLLASSAGAAAHHAFAAEFDRNQPLEVSGTVTKVEWTNPHARIYVDTVNDSGETVNWNFEMGTPNILMRNGWRRDSLQAGDQVKVTGWRARNAPLVGNAGEIFQQDGTKLFTDSSVRNAPGN